MTESPIPREIKRLLVAPDAALPESELPRVAVVIPSHDGLELLKTCLPGIPAHYVKLGLTDGEPGFLHLTSVRVFGE